MNRILIVLSIIAMLSIPVSAYDLTAPPVPSYAEKFMPADQSNLADGILEVLQDALHYIRPDLKEASHVCMRLVAIIILVSILPALPGTSQNTVNLAASIAIALILFGSTGSLVNLARTTIIEISNYGKLLLPVMTAAMAAQGAISTSAALYAGTAFFDALLTSLVGKVLTPMVYLYLLLSIASSAVGEQILRKISDTTKWVITWTLKTILYIYTGFITVSGVVSGTTDAATLKAAKLTISGMVPVVGGILSDASEAILVSIGAVKSAAGLYGLFAVLAILIGPFLKLGTHYILLKATGGICSIISNNAASNLIHDFTAAFGLLLAMIGAISLMLFISLVCFLRGVG